MQLPSRSSGRAASIYQPLGLTDMPFPLQPVVDPYNVDPRRNGAIYATEPVRTSIEKFERLLVRPNDFANRARLAYLWSRGDQETGRGMGKTALLRYFQQRINTDWGRTVYGGELAAVVIYASFPDQVDRRYMEQLAMAALVDVCKNGVLDVGRAVLRMESIPQEIVPTIVASEDGTIDPARLLDDVCLADAGIDAGHINALVMERLRNCGISEQSAQAFAEGGWENYLRSLRRDGNLEPYYVPRDTKILDYSRNLLFDDVVLFLREAGFAGGFLFVDDIENLVDQMPRRHRVEFAKEFALCTVRPGYANGQFNFFSCVLTTHQSSSVSLATAWGEAGLASIARLDPDDPNSVELPLPSTEQARGIVVAHLDRYRINERDAGTIRPFTEEAMSALLQQQHPRRLLASAGRAVSHALSQELSVIDEQCVRAALSSEPNTGPIDFTEGIEGAL